MKRHGAPQRIVNLFTSPPLRNSDARETQIHRSASMHTARRTVDLRRGVQYLPHMTSSRTLFHLHHHYGLTGRGDAHVHE